MRCKTVATQLKRQRLIWHNITQTLCKADERHEHSKQAINL